MRHTDSLGQAKEFGHEAIRLMEQHGVAPHPDNFTIWYDYVSGSRPEVTKALDAMIAEGVEFNAERCRELFTQYYDEEPDPLVVGDACDRLADLVGKVSEQIGVGADSHNAYCDRLSDLTKDIGETKGGGTLPNLVVDLLSETRSMLAKNRAMADELGKTSAQVNDLRRNLDEAREEALTDALTGIGNRKHFDHTLKTATAAAMEDEVPLSLILCDIDHFKKFNDTYGHRIGDQVLKVTARVLRESIKGRDFAARYGGEEFAVILPQTALRDAVTVADQIRRTLASRALMNKRSGESYGRITMSLGVSEMRPGEPLEQLVKRADQALYQAKRDGRNRVSDETLLETAISLSA